MARRNRSVNRMHDFDGLNDMIGTPAMIEVGKQYEATARKAVINDTACFHNSAPLLPF